jgi:transglutaminase/protease-like cytokinesis protein 3
MQWLPVTLFVVIITVQPVSGQGKVEALANEITRKCQTEKEKVSRIFDWITDNIAYRTKNSRTPVISAVSFLSEEQDDLCPLLPLNERVAEKVLASGLAVCDGYARLFKVLCDYAGIRSEIIGGYANGSGIFQSSQFGVNHYWNAAYFENEWHLLDVAWASGYVTRQGGDFVKEYNSRYFLTDPKTFIRDHYPEDPRWTLLPETAVPPAFRSSPFKQKAFKKYSITSYKPSSGIIEVEPGDTLYFEVETANAQKDRNIVPNLLIDTAMFTCSPGWVFLHPADTAFSNTISAIHTYTYIPPATGVEWLYLMYNQDIILRYKVNIKTKKPDGSTASL